MCLGKDLLNIGELLFNWRALGLAEHCTEIECFPHSRRSKVDILLLYVACFPLKPTIPLPPVY